MERAAWTDERLDDLSRRMDAGFASLETDIRELRRELRGEIEALRITMRVGGGMMVGLVGVIAAILARGA
jgi:hypothetical protein